MPVKFEVITVQKNPGEEKGYTVGLREYQSGSTLYLPVLEDALAPFQGNKWMDATFAPGADPTVPEVPPVADPATTTHSATGRSKAEGTK